MKRRRIVDNDHLTLVVRRTAFGLRHNVVMIANYKENFQEVVMTTQRYKTLPIAIESAQRIGKQLNMKVIVE